MIKFTNERLQRIYAVIPKGIERPVTAKEIKLQTGIPMRDVYSCINLLVTKYQVPIGGLRQDNKHGYFIATNKEELALAILPLERHTQRMTERLTALKQIDVQELKILSKVILIDNDKRKEIELPEFGSLTVKSQHGKIILVETINKTKLE